MKSSKKITILGGGQAAWLTAAYLFKKLSIDFFELNIIEGREPNSVGVGEGTVTTFIDFMSECGFNTQDWYYFCETTFKGGVAYQDWIKDENMLWHPFGGIRFFDERHNLFDLLAHLNIPKLEYPHYFDNWERCIVENKPTNDFLAVHLNAGKLVEFLRKNVKINIINEDIEDVLYDNDGNISSLLLSSKQKFTSDLFIDCLGLNNIIKEKNKSYNFIRHECAVNSAVFNPVKYSSPNATITPYTLSKCTPHGWIWHTPLRTRLGAGMVFNKNITSKEEAIEYYENYFGKEHLINSETRFIDFNPGYYSNQWNKNTISIGLSSGFVEPLEATGIEFICESVKEAFGGLSKGWYTEHDIQIYNGIMNSKYYTTFDFINLHYIKTEHDSPFWKFVKKTASKRMTESLKLRIKYFEDGIINSNSKELHQLFSAPSWYYSIIQFLNIYPKTKEVLLKNPEQVLKQHLIDTNNSTYVYDGNGRLIRIR